MITIQNKRVRKSKPAFFFPLKRKKPQRPFTKTNLLNGNYQVKDTYMLRYYYYAEIYSFFIPQIKKIVVNLLDTRYCKSRISFGIISWQTERNDKNFQKEYPTVSVSYNSANVNIVVNLRTISYSHILFFFQGSINHLKYIRYSDFFS